MENMGILQSTNTHQVTDYLLMKRKLTQFLKNKDFIASIVLFAVTLLALQPYLNPNLINTLDEALGYTYPMSYVHDQAISGKGSFTWFTGEYSGNSLPFQQFVSVYSPLNTTLFTYFDFVYAHHLAIVIPVLLGAWFAFLLARKLDISIEGALVVAFSYLLAFTFDWINIGPTVACSFALYPLLLFTLLGIHKSRQRWLYVLLGTTGIALGFLGGFVQYIFYFFIVSLLFALFLDLKEKSPTDMGPLWSWPIRSFPTTFWLGVMVIAGALLGIRQIAASLFLVDSSIRSLPYPVERAGLFDAAKLYTLIFPHYIKFPITGGALGLYIGGTSLLLVLLASFLRRNRFVVILITIVFILLGFAFHIPPFSYINDHVPPLDNFRYLIRYAMAASLPLALLAGIGLDLAVSAAKDDLQRVRSFTKHYLTISIIGVVLMFIGVALLNAVIDHPKWQESLVSLYFTGRDMPQPFSHYQPMLENRIADLTRSFTLSNVWLIVPLLFLIGAPLLLWLFLQDRIGRVQFRLLVPLLVACNLIFVFSYNHKSFLPVDTVLREPAVATAIKEREADQHSYRLMDYLINDRFSEQPELRGDTIEEITLVERELMRLSGNILSNIDRADGFGIFRTVRHNQLIDTIVAPKPGFVFDEVAFTNNPVPLDQWVNTHALKAVTLEEKRSAEYLQIPLMSMMNVKYIQSLVPLQHSSLEPIAVSTPLPFPVYLYENIDVLPRVYLAENVIFKMSDMEELLVELLTITDFRKTTLIECVTCPAPDHAEDALVKITAYRPGYVSVTTNSRGGEWLILSESFSPGWQAFIDGHEVAIQQANYLYQAVYLPAGVHEVEFKHEDIGALKLKEVLDVL